MLPVPGSKTGFQHGILPGILPVPSKKSIGNPLAGPGKMHGKIPGQRPGFYHTVAPVF